MSNYVAEYYRRAVDFHGNLGWQASLWSSPQVQERCFLNIVKAPLGYHGTLLDLGCGQCDLYKYLKTMRPMLAYQGIDVCSAMIEKAKQKHKDVTAFVQDFMSDKYQPQAECIVAAGPFNLKIPGVDMNDHLKKAIRKMYDCCSRAMIVDFTSELKQPHGVDPDIHYYKPKEIVDFAFTISDLVSFRHNKLDYGMTLYLYKEDDER
jgi:predicted RNA methylase